MSASSLALSPEAILQQRRMLVALLRMSLVPLYSSCLGERLLRRMRTVPVLCRRDMEGVHQE